MAPPTGSPRLLYALDFVPRATRPFDRFLVRLAADRRTAGWGVHFVFAGDPTPDAAAELAAHAATFEVIPELTTMMSSPPKSEAICWMVLSISALLLTFAW